MFNTNPVEHGSAESAQRHFGKVADHVMSGASWMGVMFEFVDGRVVVHHTTFNAPRHLLLPAVEHLRQQLTPEAMQAPLEPLPVAERFRMQVKSAEADDARPEGGE